MSIRVLIIDDEAAISGSLASFLEDSDFEVSICLSAEQALELLEHANFDAAIVDLRLPGMNGENFIIKAHAIRPELKYMIHTGSMAYQPGAQLRAIGLTEAEVFHKPVGDLNILAKAIIKLLGGA